MLHVNHAASSRRYIRLRDKETKMSKLIFLLFFFVCYMIFQALKSAMSGSKQAYMAVNGPSENYFVPPDVHHAMLESARNSEQQGIDFANHCYEEYLKTGQYFILSDIDKYHKA